jgi:predicted ATP-grasp superfamily ATP-dependent carboligase
LEHLALGGEHLTGKSLNLLLVGVDLVGLAHSARREGHRVFAADYFGDLDLKQACDRCLSVLHQEKGKSTGSLESVFDPRDFVDMARELCGEAQMDGILLSSGLDDSFDELNELGEMAPIMGNPPETVKKVREKGTFFRELKRLNIPHPRTAIVRDLEEARDAALDIGYPVVLKPLEGFAGSSIRMVGKPQTLEAAYIDVQGSSSGGVVQKYIDGTHASISLVASSSGVVTLTLNEQLLGLKEVYQREPFGYCGNIVPLDVKDSTAEYCKAIAEKIGGRFGLRGSNGIDFVISEDGAPHVVEVNPRFQGTLEAVEAVLGMNLVKTHLLACRQDVLPTNLGDPSSYSARLILYTPRRIVAPDLTHVDGVTDIPLPGSILEEGEPFCSVNSTGDSREASLGKAQKTAELIYSSIRRVRH